MPYDLTTPVKAQELAGLDARPELIQFSSALTRADFRVVSEWIRDKPQKTLRAYGSDDGSINNLDFLQWFPTLRRFRVDIHHLEDLDGLALLPDDVVSLGLGATRKRFSLAPIERFRGLRHLLIEGHSKDIAVLSGLTELVDLVLRSVTLPDLDLLRPLNRLAALDLELGGTTNLAALPAIANIRYLGLWMIRGLADLTPVAEMDNLEFLFLQAQRRVETLPDFSRAGNLRFIWMETMKGLSALSPLATAPALEHLALVDMPQLDADALLPLRNIASLKTVRAGLGSKRKNARVLELLGPLSDVDATIWNRSRYRFR